MKLTIAWVGKTKDPAIRDLTEKYLKWLNHYLVAEGLSLKDDEKLIELTGHSARASKPVLIALDTAGKQLSSEDLGEFMRKHQDGGSQNLLFAIGGSDGLNDKLLNSATLRLSLGKMTLAHELARVVLLEQLYRAFTILKGHPYHTRH